MELWGRTAPRRFFSDKHWHEPIRWNAEAHRLGTRARVFCASMADVFEPRLDLDPWRDKLWTLIEKTPNLDWLLLTKRPGHIKHVYPWATTPRENVWLGTTTETQRWAVRRIERLLSVESRVRFLSCEPLLSAIDLTPEPVNKFETLAANIY
jgi:protein gp37